ncbi:MAG: hypothetical protein QGF87_03280, partial [Woeseiaceae bacterium]|nr:hypothetical protein [Woeseiaceae bacterium]
MIALAGRIRAPSVLAVNAVLAEDDARQALRVNLLSAAVRRAESAVTEGAAPADRRALVGLLLARADVALRMGLPVQGVVAYAASFGDGVHKSVPAPGRGALAAVL